MGTGSTLEKGFLQELLGAEILGSCRHHLDDATTHVPDHCKQLTHSNEPLSQLVRMRLAILQGQFWCDHPGHRTGTSQGQPSSSILQQGRRSHAGNRAAPTHASAVLCMHQGLNPAFGPVMNITQEDPTLVQGPAFP